jgi:hypothetical protein
MWPRRLPSDATVSASLAFYRFELERRRDYVLNAWRRAGLTWCFSGLAIVLVPALVNSLNNPRLLLRAAPFFILLAIWFAMYFRMRKRNQQKLQREIDELNALESEIRS